MNVLPTPPACTHAPVRGTLLFFSDTVPTEESGSFVVFRRHFLPLVDTGWRLKVFSYFPPPAASLFWEHVRLPHRLSWWPPARPASLFSQRVRIALMLRHLRRTVRFDAWRPCVLLANLWDPQALFAAALARRKVGPLGVFMHDDEITWNRETMADRYLVWRRKRVTGAAGRIWAVSARLAAQLGPAVRCRCRVLRPLSARPAAPPAQWRPAFAQGVHLGCAGKVYPGLAPLLKKTAEVLGSLGGRLTVITEPSLAACPPLAAGNLAWRPYFARPETTMTWLRDNCSALLVAHPLAGNLPPGKWHILRTSFPSKLAEYAQLGLPLVLAGDFDSEFSDWASTQADIPFFDAVDDNFAACLARLRSEADWKAASAAVSRLAAGEFSPARIQAEFVSDLESLLR